MATYVRNLPVKMHLLNRVVNKMSFQTICPLAAKMHVLTNLDSKTGIAQVKLNKPPVNSLNYEFLSEISETIKKLENTKECRGFVLTSNVPKIFSAGLDIMEMYQPKIERMTAFWTALQQVWIDLYGTKLVSIAAITGHAPAGGCLLAASCDYRIMVTGKSTIGMNETLLGIVAPLWFQATMKNTIGHRKTEMALSLGAMYNAEEALKLGMIDDIATTPDEVVQKANAEIMKWIKIPAIARQATKKNLRQHFIDKLEAERELDVKKFVAFATADKTQKTLGAYLEALKSKKG